MIIKTTIIYLYGPSCREDGEIIEWSPSVHSSLRPPPSAAEIEVQQLKKRYHRHKDIKVIVGLIGSQGKSGMF